MLSALGRESGSGNTSQTHAPRDVTAPPASHVLGSLERTHHMPESVSSSVCWLQGPGDTALPGRPARRTTACGTASSTSPVGTGCLSTRPRVCRFVGQPLLSKPRPRLHPWGAVMSSQPLKPLPTTPFEVSSENTLFPTSPTPEGPGRSSVTYPCPNLLIVQGRRKANKETFPRPPPPADQ